MIPSAQTLADILNDPAIPSEAKPECLLKGGKHKKFGLCGAESNVLCVEDPPHLSIVFDTEATNAALFWSLSAWLWGRGICPWIDESIHTGYFAAEYRGDDSGPHAWPTKPTPVEALAAVVREVAQTR